MYELLGICLVLAALLSLNALASLVTAALWRVMRASAQRWLAMRRVRFLFLLRVLPPVGALVGVAMFLVPAYITLEPRQTTERVSVKLAALAFVSVAGLMLALWRGLLAWVATRRLVARWLREAEPLALENISIPAYRFPHRFPIIAIVGVFRPRLFVADRVLHSLSRAELAAALAHEQGHLAARDNLKRGLLRACRDVLTIVPCGRSLDREWAEAAESAADEHAARKGAAVALDLAAALVKIARLAPAEMRPALPAGALLMGDQASGIGSRVHRLTQLATMTDAGEARRALALRVAAWTCAGGFLIGAALIASSHQLLATVHAAIEQIVSVLR